MPVSTGFGPFSLSRHLSRLELFSHFRFILLPPVHRPYVELRCRNDRLHVANCPRFLLHLLVLLDETPLFPRSNPFLRLPSRLALSHGASSLRASLFVLRPLLRLLRHLSMVLSSSLRPSPPSRVPASSSDPSLVICRRHSSSIHFLADPIVQSDAEAVFSPSERPRLSPRRRSPLSAQTRPVYRHSVPSPAAFLSLDGCDRDDAGDRTRVHRTTRHRGNHNASSKREDRAKSSHDSPVRKRLLAERCRRVADAVGLTVPKSFLHGHAEALGRVCRRRD